MANEKWEQVKEIFDAALRHKPEDRSQFLDEICAGDITVRREVESLLSSFERADSFMQKPAVGEMPEMPTIKKNVFIKGQRLSHYEIIKQIGRGGMGEVYLARDLKLNRQVTVKFLTDKLSRNRDHLQRFIQEAQAASALNHPNIITIYEIGEFEGAHFIAAEYIEGETLRQLLNRGELNLNEILDIAIQTAVALSAAHAARIVHRDIKPENIMRRADGLIKVLDFGLAKLTERQTGAIGSEDETLALVKTNPGVVQGTTAYMSPEQARGKETDVRTDIWSFGVVLYEMLAGKAPFAGETISDTIAAILKNEPVPLSEISSDIPKDLERIVNKSLRKNREQRYQHIKDLLIDLRDLKQDLEFAAKLERSGAPSKNEKEAKNEKTAVTNIEKSRAPSDAEHVFSRQHRRGFLVVLAALFLAVIGLSYWLYSNRTASTDAKQIESIAVMPFENASGNQDAEYLADGMTETLINSLLQIPKLNVKARSTVFRYKGKELNAQSIGKELNAQAVLLGRIVQRGDNLLLSLSLEDAKTGDQIWGDQYNRKMTDLVSLQNEIARDVSHKLKTKLSGTDEQKLAKKYTENAEAYQLYLRGRFHWNKRTVKELQKAIEYFQQAVAVDPNYALGYAGLADAYTLFSNLSDARPQEVMPKAKDAALRALSLDNELAEALAALGIILFLYDYDFVAAERELKRAIELNPNYPTAHHFYARLLSAQGRHEEAIAEARRAVELEPLALPLNWFYGHAFIHARRYDEGIAQLKKTQELDAGFPGTHFHLARAYQAKGKYAESVEEYAKYHDLLGNQQTAAAARENFARSGWQGFLRAMIQRPDSDLYVKASFHAALGEKDRAFAELNKAYENRDASFITYVKVDPRLDPLRDDPRFAELLRRVGLEP